LADAVDDRLTQDGIWEEGQGTSVSLPHDRGLSDETSHTAAGVVRLLVGGRTGRDTVARSCSCSHTGYIAPYAEGSLPKSAVFGGRYEMAAKLEVGVNAAMGG